MEALLILVIVGLIVLFVMLTRKPTEEHSSRTQEERPRRVQSRGNSRPIVIQKAAVEQARQLSRLRKELLEMGKLTGRPSSWKGHEPPEYYSDWEEMPDYIYGYFISGVDDEDCCETCRALDGKGIYHIDILRFFKPPFCKECRCHLVPITKDDGVGKQLPYPAVDLEAVCGPVQGGVDK